MDNFWLIVIGVIVVITFFKCVRIVPQASCYITEFLGKYKSSWQAGLHFKIPFFERVAKKVVLKEQTFDFPPQNVITKDNVMVQIDSVVFLMVTDPKLYTYGIDNPNLALENLSATTLRSVLGELTFDEALASREVINAKMVDALDKATDPWGIKITRVEIKNIEPPADIRDAMTKQMKAERERRQTELEAEAHKKAVVTRAEGDKEALVLRAEAERDAKIAKAEAEAKSIELVYKAEAEGITRLNEAGITQEVLNLKGIESLKDIANGNSAKIFMPTDITKLVTLGGILGESMGIGNATPAKPKPSIPDHKDDDCCDSATLSPTTKQIVSDYEGRKTAANPANNAANTKKTGNAQQPNN